MFKVAQARPENQAALVFAALVLAFSQDACSAEVDALASELAPLVGQHSSPTCVGLVPLERYRMLESAVLFLGTYGLTFQRRTRQQGDGVFVYASVTAPVESEFTGARVVVKRKSLMLEPLPVVAA